MMISIILHTSKEVIQLRHSPRTIALYFTKVSRRLMCVMQIKKTRSQPTSARLALYYASGLLFNVHHGDRDLATVHA